MLNAAIDYEINLNKIVEDLKDLKSKICSHEMRIRELEARLKEKESETDGNPTENETGVDPDENETGGILTENESIPEKENKKSDGSDEDDI